jgi:hypothetical protein
MDPLKPVTEREIIEAAVKMAEVISEPQGVRSQVGFGAACMLLGELIRSGAGTVDLARDLVDAQARVDDPRRMFNDMVTWTPS